MSLGSLYADFPISCCGTFNQRFQITSAARSEATASRPPGAWLFARVSFPFCCSVLDGFEQRCVQARALLRTPQILADVCSAIDQRRSVCYIFAMFHSKAVCRVSRFHWSKQDRQFWGRVSYFLNYFTRLWGMCLCWACFLADVKPYAQTQKKRSRPTCIHVNMIIMGHSMVELRILAYSSLHWRTCCAFVSICTLRCTTVHLWRRRLSESLVVNCASRTPDFTCNKWYKHICRCHLQLCSNLV
jgi:hypothetical protein